MQKTIYQDGTYGDANPDWHSADSAWKADLIVSILDKHKVKFESCSEIGCGAGRVLAHLAKQLPNKTYRGFDVSPDAAKHWLTLPRSSVSYLNVDFTETDFSQELLLLLDVFEHVEDYMGFLRKLSRRAEWFVFHVPLEMHFSALLRDQQLQARQKVGHLHYFSRATALATLQDTGYTIVDEYLTMLSQETTEGRRALTIAANVARKGLELASSNFAAKLLGGYSLIALCKPNRS